MTPDYIAEFLAALPPAAAFLARSILDGEPEGGAEMVIRHVRFEFNGWAVEIPELRATAGLPAPTTPGTDATAAEAKERAEFDAAALASAPLMKGGAS